MKIIAKYLCYSDEAETWDRIQCLGGHGDIDVILS